MKIEENPWNNLLLPSPNENDIWELFHENSKIWRHSSSLSNGQVRTRMQELYESLSYEGYPLVELPKTPTWLSTSLSETLSERESIRHFQPISITLQSLGTLLHYAYGITRENIGTDLPRPLRTVPSAGALYPLEIFFYSSCIKNILAGLYHFNPSKNHLRLLKESTNCKAISDALVQPSLAIEASLIFFITGIFERTTFKYGDRGYRFAFLEAGHVAQNLNLVSLALGLSSVNIGGFRDCEIDDYLGIDGITHSSIYLVAVGKKAEQKEGILTHSI